MSEARNLTGFAGADPFRLPIALAASLAIHALVVIGAHFIAADHGKAEASPPLQATLRPPPAAAAPVLLAPEVRAETSALPAKPRRPPAPRRQGGLAVDDLTARALGQVANNLLYPPEAIARGLEGEALVTVFLDEQGNAVAARLERSSRHPILDEAAVRAAQTVRALPDGASREVLLPVRFRLR